MEAHQKDMYYRKLKAVISYPGKHEELRILVERACGMSVPLNSHNRKVLRSLLKLKHKIPVIT